MKSDTVAIYKSEIVITYSLLYLLAEISNEAKDKPKTYIFISISCFFYYSILKLDRQLFLGAPAKVNGWRKKGHRCFLRSLLKVGLYQSWLMKKA